MATDSHSADTFFILRSAMELYQSEQIGKVNPVALRVLDSGAWSKSRILSNISGSISASRGAPASCCDRSLLQE
jgi:hypothetical protein